MYKNIKKILLIMKKILLIFIGLIIGLLIGIIVARNNVQVVEIVSPGNGNHGLIEMKCCGQNITYYYEK